MKRLLVPGLLGVGVLLVWMLIVNVLLGFRPRMEMKRVPNEDHVYAVLAVNVTEPGQYLCNPEPLPDGSPDRDAASYGILYSGVGHGSTGARILSRSMIVFAPLLATWLLSLMPDVLLRSWLRKTLVFTAIGLVIALSVRLQEFGVAARTPGDALKLAIHDVVLWTVMGVAVGWRLRHRSARG